MEDTASYIVGHCRQSGGLLLRRLGRNEGAADPGVAAALDLCGGHGDAGGEPFVLIVEVARPGDPDRVAARNRVSLRRRLLQRSQREALGRRAQVHVRAADQVPRLIDVVPVREVLDVVHAGPRTAPPVRPGAASYHPSVTRLRNCCSPRRPWGSPAAVCRPPARSSRSVLQHPRGRCRPGSPGRRARSSTRPAASRRSGRPPAVRSAAPGSDDACSSRPEAAIPARRRQNVTPPRTCTECDASPLRLRPATS